ncbi:hypothetical protein GQ457_08G006840 [Hibiscus cannabinus]
MDSYHHFNNGETHLPPGFRFHPTNEELMTCYLLKKVFDSSFTCRAIAEVDLNKCEPWELPVALPNPVAEATFAIKAQVNTRRSRPQCSHCGLLGHTKEKCYKLHGYPPGYVSRSKNQVAYSNAAVDVTGTDSLSTQQCQQLIAMLTSQLQTASSSSAVPSSSSVNFAMQGKILSFVNSLSSVNIKHSRIIDSGASCHVCYSKELFESLYPIPAGSILLPNKTIVYVGFAGNVRLSESLLLKNVLFVPEFHFNLLADLCQVIGKGEYYKGLYLLQLPSANSDKLVSESKFVVNESVVLASWHDRLGHPSHSVLHSLKDVLPSVDINKSNVCPICPLAKQKHLPFPVSVTVTHSPFEMIHCDIWDPYKMPTHDVFRSDNAPELKFNQLFSDLGIIHHFSCVETPQQNSVVERKHQHLLSVARALFYQARIPIQFWGECVLTATYVINRLPSKILDGKSPYETHDKFTERALPAVFLGYAPGVKGYKVYVLQNHTIMISRNVIFHEEIFPFHTIAAVDSLVDPFPAIVLPHPMQGSSYTTQDSVVQSSVELLPEHNHENVASDMLSEEAQTSPHVSADIQNPEVEDTDLIHDIATDLEHDLVEDNQAHGVQNEVFHETVIPAVRRSTRDEWVISRVFQKSGTGNGGGGAKRTTMSAASIVLYQEPGSPSSVSLPTLLDPMAVTGGASLTDRDSCSYDSHNQREHVSCFSTNAATLPAYHGGFDLGLPPVPPPEMINDSFDSIARYTRNVGVPVFPSLRSLEENPELPFFLYQPASAPLQGGPFAVYEEGNTGKMSQMSPAELDCMWTY